VQRILDRDPALAHERPSKLRSDITAAVRDLRALVGDLRPPALEELGLIPAIEFLLWRADTEERAGAEKVEVAITVEGSVRRLDPPSELAVFRIIQEAWNNIRRHAHAPCALRLHVHAERAGRDHTR
jgi:signal transduction histidine kinase